MTHDPYAKMKANAPKVGWRCTQDRNLWMIMVVVDVAAVVVVVVDEDIDNGMVR